MTMDEVNERFPLMKYKAWMASRAEEGLPTAGGVAAPSSRPGSVRNQEGISEAANPTRKSHESHRSHTSQEPAAVTAPIPSDPTSEKAASPEPRVDSTNEEPPSSSPASPKSPQQPNTTDASSASPNSNAPVPEYYAYKPPASTPNPEDDHSDGEDDDQIQNAVPTEMMDHPGDSCAICIDTLENDDDVRGLTCGHAFHASCLDPWLTSRRACCPLCKADYYVPKPRPEGDAGLPDGSSPAGAGGAGGVGRRQPGMSNVRGDGPNATQSAYIGGRGRPRIMLPGRLITIGRFQGGSNRHGFPPVQRQQRPAADRQPPIGSNAVEITGGTPEQTQQPTGWRSRLPNLRIPNPVVPSRFRQGRTPAADGAPGAAPATTRPPQERTPGQLEAAS